MLKEQYKGELKINFKKLSNKNRMYDNEHCQTIWGKLRKKKKDNTEIIETKVLWMIDGD